MHKTILNQADDSTPSPVRLTVIEQGSHLSTPNATCQQWRVKDTRFTQTLREEMLTPAHPAIYLAYRCLLEQFEAMLAEESRAWKGDDPEGVHQMRVATRRLRAAFR